MKKAKAKFVKMVSPKALKFGARSIKAGDEIDININEVARYKAEGWILAKKPAIKPITKEIEE